MVQGKLKLEIIETPKKGSTNERFVGDVKAHFSQFTAMEGTIFYIEKDLAKARDLLEEVAKRYNDEAKKTQGYITRTDYRVTFGEDVRVFRSVNSEADDKLLLLIKYNF